MPVTETTSNLSSGMWVWMRWRTTQWHHDTSHLPAIIQDQWTTGGRILSGPTSKHSLTMSIFLLIICEKNNPVCLSIDAVWSGVHDFHSASQEKKADNRNLLSLQVILGPVIGKPAVCWWLWRQAASAVLLLHSAYWHEETFTCTILVLFLFPCCCIFNLGKSLSWNLFD